MARIIHINCPKCGGTLGMGGTERIVDCRFCGTRSLVEAPDMVPEYYVEPSISEVEARRSLQKFLMEDDMPDGLLKYARFHSARLYLVPYYEYSGRRLGTRTTTHHQEARRPRRLGPSRGLPASARDVEGWEASGVKEADTRVVISDVAKLQLAVELEDWGLEYSELERLRSRPQGTLHPVTRRELERRGSVFDPSLSVEQMISTIQAAGFTAWDENRTEIAEVRVKRIYYPVWRMRYHYQGKRYGATLDGVTGRLLSARAPQNDRWRVLWMLGTSAVVSLVFGIILREVFMGFLSLTRTQEEPPIMIVAFQILMQTWWIFAIIALMVLGLGWDRFRYQGEVVMRGDGRTVIKIGRPGKTWFDKAREKIFERIKKQWKLEGR